MRRLTHLWDILRTHHRALKKIWQYTKHLWLVLHLVRQYFKWFLHLKPFNFKLMHQTICLISTSPFLRQSLSATALLNDVKILPNFHHRLFYWAAFWNSFFSFISLIHLLDFRWWHFWDPGFSGEAFADADLGRLSRS